ncbi:chromosome condensation complex Condensin, subunit G [Microbotryomycetes sp. JL221]|nr:chromosome condensation complex Condensin, subunit G [Microbotryomycetes sp. JL221]
MPGARTARTAASSSATAVDKRAASKQSTTKDDVDSLSDALDAQVAALFQQAQNSVASHRKLVNSLYHLFQRCASFTTMSSSGRTIKLTGERMFGERIRSCLVYALGCKKGIEQADRIIKFVAAFVAFAVDVDLKRAEARQQEKQQAKQDGDDDNDDDQVEDDDEPEGPSSRLVAQLLAFLLRGFTAKSKIARFRCVQLVALMINSLGEVDDDTYQHLKAALLERVHDKESSVRMQAVVALSKLQEADEADSDDEDSNDPDQNVTMMLMDVLLHDPAAEVRRAALFNLLPSPMSLAAIVSRTLDVDTINRRATFSHVLIDVPCASLSNIHREEIARRGLQDREEAVVKAAKKLMSKWVDETGGLIELLQGFDVFGGVAAQPLAEAIFDTRPDLVANMQFDEAFWQALTPWSAFAARTYFDYLRKLEDPRLGDIEPVVTALAFHIQAEWTKLVVLLEAEEHDEGEQVMQEFVVAQVCQMAVNLDYGDEIGRRKMFELMREMLSHFMLPASLVSICLDVLLKVTTSEKEFMRVVVEIVQSLRADSQLMTSEDERTRNADDDEDEDAETYQARRKKAMKERAIEMVKSERRRELDLRCLAIVKALLERVTGALHENSMLHGLVTELVVPAIKQKDSALRSLGLVCLGLVSLLDKSTALDSFELLARQSQDTEGELQVMILQALFDLLVLHGINFGTERGFGPDIILGFLMSSLEQEQPEAVATAVVGTAKLILSGAVSDEEILSRLALLYFASETADNQELRQCLSYFFPVYCYSNPTNQRHVANAFLPTLSVLKGVYDDLSTTERAGMVAPLQIGLQLIDWTDPQKTIDAPGVELDEMVQVDLAMSMVKKVYTEEQKDERKLLCQLLCKLYIPDEVDRNHIRSLLWLGDQLKQNRPLTDAVSRNAFERFLTSLNKILTKQQENEDEVNDEADSNEKWKESEVGKDVKVFIAKIEGDEDSEDEREEDDEEDSDGQDEEDEDEGDVQVSGIDDDDDDERQEGEGEEEDDDEE